MNAPRDFSEIYAEYSEDEKGGGQAIGCALFIVASVVFLAMFAAGAFLLDWMLSGNVTRDKTTLGTILAIGYGLAMALSAFWLHERTSAVFHDKEQSPGGTANGELDAPDSQASGSGLSAPKSAPIREEFFHP